MSILLAEVEGAPRVHIRDYTEALKGKVKCAIGHPLVAKRGAKIVHHYAHRAGVACDAYHNNKGDWHMAMQDRIMEDCLEIRMVNKEGKLHIADAVVNGVVIEFQNSPMTLEIIREREHFYTKDMGLKMIWVFNCSRDTNRYIDTEKRDGDMIRAKWNRRGCDWGLNASVPTYLDLGTMNMLEVLEAHPKTGRFIARIVTVDEFEKRWYSHHIDTASPGPVREEKYMQRN